MMSHTGTLSFIKQFFNTVFRFRAIDNNMGFHMFTRSFSCVTKVAHGPQIGHEPHSLFKTKRCNFYLSGDKNIL